MKRGVSASGAAHFCALSAPTTRKLVTLYGTREDKQRAQGNKAQALIDAGKIRRGKHSPLKGRTYEEIFGSKERARERSQKTSLWMKKHNIRKFATRVSKPQRLLFEIVRELFPTAVLEYEVVLQQSRSVWLDVAIPESKIDFEYDGKHWHDMNNKHCVRSGVYTDEERDSLLKNEGWCVLRFVYSNNPDKDCLRQDLMKKLKENSICV